MPAIQPFPPEALAGLGIEAIGDSVIGNDEQVVAGYDGGGHVGGSIVRSPSDVGFSHVSGSVRIDRENVLLRITTCHKDILSIVDHGGDELFGWPVDDLMAFAGSWIVTRHTETAGEDHLGAVTDLADDGGDITTGLVFPHRAPTYVAGFALERHNISLAVVIPVDDNKIFKQHWTGVEPVCTDKGTCICFPLFVPFEIVGGHHDPTRCDHAFRFHIGRDDFFAFGHQEGDVNEFAISGRRARGAAVQAMNGLGRRLDDHALPERPPIEAIQAEQLALVLLS